MSKTTIFLFALFLILIGLLLFVLSNKNQNPIIAPFTKPQILQSSISDLSLSLSTSSQIVTSAQTMSVAVIIHNPTPHPSIVQIELGYNPQIMTVDSITPGTFFTNPTTALQNVDPTTGRISYALHCPTLSTNIDSDCVNPHSSTVAIITFTLSPYLLKNTTAISFLPKTVVRTRSGKDLLQHMNGLQLTVEKPLFPIATSSATASPGANYFHAIPPAPFKK
jgi:hypothetical protein